MDDSPEEIERAEQKRVARLVSNAKANHPRLRISKANIRKMRTHQRRDVTVRLPFRVLGLTPAGVADQIQRQLLNRATRQVLQEPGIQHVKDGKPLTAHGAKLLGVPWPQ